MSRRSWRRTRARRCHRCCSRRRQPEIRAYRRRPPWAAWSRGARIWEGPRGEPAAPPHPAGRCCARRASAHAHPAAVPRPCPADQRPLQSGAQAAAAAQVPPTGRGRRGRTCAGSPRRRQRTAERSEGVLYARGRPAVCSRGLVDDLCRKYVHPGAALGQRRAAAAGGAGQICAAYALSPRALRRGGAPAALAHKLRRQGPAALCQPPARPLRPWAGGTRGGGAWYATHRARGRLCGPRSAAGAGWRELGASPLRARPPGRLQARALACRSRALRRRWEMPAIAHD